MFKFKLRKDKMCNKILIFIETDTTKRKLGELMTPWHWVVLGTQTVQPAQRNYWGDKSAISQYDLCWSKDFCAASSLFLSLWSSRKHHNKYEYWSLFSYLFWPVGFTRSSLSSPSFLMNFMARAGDSSSSLSSPLTFSESSPSTCFLRYFLCFIRLKEEMDEMIYWNVEMKA